MWQKLLFAVLGAFLVELSRQLAKELAKDIQRGQSTDRFVVGGGAVVLLPAARRDHRARPRRQEGWGRS